MECEFWDFFLKPASIEYKFWVFFFTIGDYVKIMRILVVFDRSLSMEYNFLIFDD